MPFKPLLAGLTLAFAATAACASDEVSATPASRPQGTRRAMPDRLAGRAGAVLR